RKSRRDCKKIFLTIVLVIGSFYSPHSAASHTSFVGKPIPEACTHLPCTKRKPKKLPPAFFCLHMQSFAPGSSKVAGLGAALLKVIFLGAAFLVVFLPEDFFGAVFFAVAFFAAFFDAAMIYLFR